MSIRYVNGLRVVQYTAQERAALVARAELRYRMRVLGAKGNVSQAISRRVNALLAQPFAPNGMRLSVKGAR